MAFPTSPTNGQIYKNYYYNSTKNTWLIGAGIVGSTNIGEQTFGNGVTVFTDINISSKLTQRVRSHTTGGVAGTKALIRQFNDVSNWSSSLVLIEYFISGPTFDVMNYGMHIAKWGYGGAGTEVVTKISGGLVPYWGPAILINGYHYYRDLLVDYTAYLNTTVSIKFPGTNERTSSTPEIGSGAIYVYPSS